MYRIKGFSNGKEAQCMVKSFGSAIKLLNKSKQKAASIQILCPNGKLRAVYITGLGTNIIK